MTNWSALPVAGGLYDQHPQLMDEWSVIFQAKAHHEALEKAKHDAQMAKAQRRRK